MNADKRYRVLAYGSQVAPDLDEQVDTTSITALFKAYPFVVVAITSTVEQDMLKTAVQFREVEWIH